MFHPKEIHLVKETLASNKISKTYNDNEESLKMERNFIMIPRLTSYLHGLHSQYPSFGPAVNIAKRWLYSHLIHPLLWPEEATELLMASLYLSPETLVQPTQPEVGYFRFLYFIAYTDWSKELVIINFNNTLNGMIFLF